jgi:hypothetical protein
MEDFDKYIQAVKRSCNIVEVIGADVGDQLKKRGSEYKCCCPFHSERTPSFSVSERNQAYYCFGCGSKGDVIEYIRQRQNINALQAADQLAQRYCPAEYIRYRSDKPSDHSCKDLQPAPPPQPRKTTPQQPFYLEQRWIEQGKQLIEQTTFYKFLIRYFPADDVRQVLSAYNVGGSAKYRGAVLFPYIAAGGQIIDAKIMSINEISGSRKDATPLRSWTDRDGLHDLRCTFALAEMHQSDSRGRWCLFGEHLLQQRPDADLCIVESEKTVIVAAIAYPQYIWLAVGGKSNLTADRLQAAAGRNITIFPDADGYEDQTIETKSGKPKITLGWQSIAQQLTADGLKIDKIDQTVKRQGKGHDDIADIILRYIAAPPETAAERLFRQMAEQQPYLREFAEQLFLQPTKIETV